MALTKTQLLKHDFPVQGLLTFSLQMSEDFWISLDFPSDRSIFSAFVGGYESTVIAEKREENPEILTS